MIFSKNSKKVLSLIMLFILVSISIISFSAQGLSTTKNTLKERKFANINLKELKDDEFDMSSVMVILKDGYSLPDKQVTKNLFSNVACKNINTVMSSSKSNKENSRNIIHLELEKSGRTEVEQAIKALSKRKEVLYAGPNLNWEAEGQFIPNDPYIQNEERLKPYRNIGLPEAWDITTGSRDVAVANNEQIAYDHLDLRANMWVNPNPTTAERHGYNFDHPEGSVYPPKGKSHGTITAGVIGAVGNNGIGTAGVAHQVSLLSVSANGGYKFSQMIDFLNKHNVGILNISLGWGTTEDPVITQSFLNYNGLVTVAAGNNNTNLDNLPSNNTTYTYPASYSRHCPNVLSVAAVDSNDNLHGYSCYGPQTVSIAAPADYWTTNIDNKYGSYGGTSTASPVVAGAAALIKSKAPHFTWEQIANTILNNVDVLPELKGKIKNAGRLNIHKALKSITAEKGTYFIRNAKSGLYLDAAAPNYTNLIQHSFMGNENEKFKIGDNTLQSVYNNKYLTEGSPIASHFKSAIVGNKDNVYFSKNNDGSYCILKKVDNVWKGLTVY